MDSQVIPDLPAHTSYVMDAINMATFTGIVGTEYHLQEQLVYTKAIITMENDYHAPDTPEINVVTEEAIADLISGLTQETEA